MILCEKLVQKALNLIIIQFEVIKIYQKKSLNSLENPILVR